jgi:hypothetical protein
MEINALEIHRLIPPMCDAASIIVMEDVKATYKNVRMEEVLGSQRVVGLLVC